MTCRTEMSAISRPSAARRDTSRSVMTPAGLPSVATTKKLMARPAISLDASCTVASGGMVTMHPCMICDTVLTLMK